MAIIMNEHVTLVIEDPGLARFFTAIGSLMLGKFIESKFIRGIIGIEVIEFIM